MRKKLVLILIAVMAMTVFFTGCATVSAVPLGENEHATLRLFAGGSQWRASYAENLQRFVDDFNAGKFENAKETLKIEKIVLEKVEDVETTYATRLRSNDKYPHLFLFDRFNTPTYVKNDFVLDLTDRIAKAKIDTTSFVEEAMLELRYDSQTIGLPVDVDIWGVYVNTDLVDAYNTSNPGSQIVLNENWTWDDLYSMASKLTKRNANNEVTLSGYSSHDLEQHFFKYFVSTGTDFLLPDLTPNMKTGAAEDTLEFFKLLKDANVCSTSVEDIFFPNGQIAMINRSTYFDDYIKHSGKQIKYKFLPQPKYSIDGVVQDDALNGGMLGGFGLVVPKPIEKLRNERFESFADRSFDLINWWAAGEGAKYWAEYTNTLPALKSIHNIDSVQKNDVLKSAASYYPSYKIRNQVPGFQNYQIYAINTAVGNYLKGGALATALNELSSKREFEI